MRTLLIFLVGFCILNYTFALDRACSEHTSCSSCIDSGKCGWCYGDRTCYDIGADLCKSKLYEDECPSFFDTNLLIGSITIFIGAILTAGGGVGGGPVYVPILMLVLGFSPRLAIPLSKVTIFGVAIGGFSVLSRKRHPKGDRPLINYDLAFMMEPMTLLGSIIGVYFNMTFPTYILMVCLVLVLGFSGYKTITKGVQLYKQEKKAEIEAKSKQVERDDVNFHKLEEVNENENEIQTTEENDIALESLLRQESKTPWWQMLFLILLEIGMLFLLLLKGGTTGESIVGVTCGSVSYWILVILTIPYLGLFSYGVGRYLRKKHERKVLYGFPFHAEDVKWTYKKTVALPFLFILAGLAAGFLGIGAGLVVGPIFLDMGILPQVAVATSSYMILYTSISTVIQFLINGKLPWDYALWYFFIGLIGATIGQTGLSKLIQKYKKQAFINFLLGGIIVLSVISMTVVEGISLSSDIKEHKPMGFNPICVSHY